MCFEGALKVLIQGIGFFADWTGVVNLGMVQKVVSRSLYDETNVYLKVRDAYCVVHTLVIES